MCWYSPHKITDAPIDVVKPRVQFLHQNTDIFHFLYCFLLHILHLHLHLLHLLLVPFLHVIVHESVSSSCTIEITLTPLIYVNKAFGTTC